MRKPSANNRFAQQMAAGTNRRAQAAAKPYINPVAQAGIDRGGGQNMVPRRYWPQQQQQQPERRPNPNGYRPRPPQQQAPPQQQQPQPAPQIGGGFGGGQQRVQGARQATSQAQHGTQYWNDGIPNNNPNGPRNQPIRGLWPQPQQPQQPPPYWNDGIPNNNPNGPRNQPPPYWRDGIPNNNPNGPRNQPFRPSDIAWGGSQGPYRPPNPQRPADIAWGGGAERPPQQDPYAPPPGWQPGTPLPVGWAQVGEGDNAKFVQGWNQMSPEERSQLANSVNPNLNQAHGGAMPPNQGGGGDQMYIGGSPGFYGPGGSRWDAIQDGSAFENSPHGPGWPPGQGNGNGFGQGGPIGGGYGQGAPFRGEDERWERYLRQLLRRQRGGGGGGARAVRGAPAGSGGARGYRAGQRRRGKRDKTNTRRRRSRSDY